ncbi:oligosaccharide flippase family protein [Castellaniella ginsengisoli]|uniref:Oligosaccharide flippase family protein n=1 Tax=Castellaniella ginsengisoli TaxID=546114 RepID=A0AB39EWX6_9BURK
MMHRKRLSSYWQRVAVVFSGAALSQAIPIAGSLLIARLYVPAEFGLFAAWYGVSVVLNLFLTARLDAAFGLASDGVERGRLVVATVLVVLGMGGLLGLLTWLVVGLWPAGLFGVSAALTGWLAPMCLCAALSVVWQAWAANNGQIHALNAIRLVQAAGVTGLQILAAWFNPVAESLVVAQIAGTAVAVCVAIRLLPILAYLPRAWSELQLLWSEVWRKYWRFPLLAMPSDMINASAAQLPVIVLAARYGGEVAGCFALASRTLGAPLAVLGAAVRDVFIRDAGLEMRTHGHCRQVYRRTFRILALLSFCLVLVTVPLAESAFTLVFGEPWRLAGVMAIWLVPLFALRFIASPLSYTFFLAQKQKVDLIWQSVLLGMVIVVLYGFDSYRLTLIAYGAGYAGMYVVYLMLSSRYGGRQTAGVGA